ncbi:short transient receptor potential channel 5-like [Lytechinus variegatus]|uniref:short transient receptor potential channel 5-like n=1 Tax=Lytechinus variegatus TaxID=7654 RepID=UPI001BB1BA98|nr:short transient receptor potential channel 5-like [Lytechinus variegatus]
MTFKKFYRQKLFEAIESMDLLLVRKLLSRPDDYGSDWNYRDKNGRSVYAHAIKIGITQMVATFIDHEIPLGDALLRAADFCMVDIVRYICAYAETLGMNQRNAIIECHCENDDYHKFTTPLMAAAHKNNFSVVKILLDAGAVLKEPRIKHIQPDLTGTAIVLMTYRAIATEAYLVQAFSDPLDVAFGLGRRLRELADRWEDASEQVLKIVDRVEQFAADFVGQANYSSEVRSILKFTRSESKHPVAKVRAAMKAYQKPFVIHPFTQSVLRDSYYDEMKGKNFTISSIIALLTIVCYPFLSFAFLLYPTEMLQRFLKIPNIKLYMNMGSDLTLMSCVIALVLYDNSTHPIITLFLEITIFIFCIGISGKHVKFIYKQGPEKFCSYPLSILDSLMVKICYTTLYVAWIGRLIDMYDQRIMQRYVNPFQEAQPVMAPSTVNNSNMRNFDAESNIALSDVTPTWLFASWNEPRVVSHTLYSVVALVCVVRTFYVLSVNHVGIFVVAKSVIGMGADVLRVGVFFVCVNVAFGVGMTQASRYRLHTARAECAVEGSLPSDCPKTPFHSIPQSLLNLYWVLYNIFKNPDAGTSLRPGDSYTLFLPAFILMAYTFIAVIVLLNLLIAVMTSRYSKVEKNADREWMFFRTQLWMSFISDDITLPPPFNILPSVDKVWRTIQACCCPARGKKNKEKTKSQKKQALKSAVQEYIYSQKMMKALRDRFVKSRENSLQQNSEVGGKRALLVLGRTDLLTFRNEWVDLRQQVSVAERDLQTMLQQSTQLIAALKEKIELITHVERRHVSSSFDIDGIYDSFPVIENSLEQVGDLMETLRTLPAKELLKPVKESPAEVEVEEEKTEEEIKVEIKKEIVKAMARAYELGRRPEDDEELMEKLRQYRKRFETS